MMDSIRVLGVRVDVTTLDEAAGRVLGWIRDAREGRALRGKMEPAGRDLPHLRWVTTPNPEMVAAAARTPDLRQILNRADLAVPDGVGLVWAARRRGADLPGRVPGLELLTEILSRGEGQGLRVFLLGAEPGVAAEAARESRRRWPGLSLVGTHHGYFPPSEDERVARVVRGSGAELVAVGMGSPRQELWISRQSGLLSGMVALGVGGSLDVLSGRVTRAPAWMSRRGLEWLGRFLAQPRRFKRAPALARFVLAVLCEERREGRNSTRPE